MGTFYNLRMRRAAKRDTNERKIIDALKAMGASVMQIDGENEPDLLVGYRGRNYLMEVKYAKAPRVKQALRERGTMLSPGQQKWHEEFWKGQTSTVSSVEEALSVIQEA